MGRSRQIMAARIDAGSKRNLYFLYMHVVKNLRVGLFTSTEDF